MTDPDLTHPTSAEYLRDSLLPVLALLGIARVISVDDDNADETPNGDFDSAEVIAALTGGTLAMEDLVRDPILREALMVDDEVRDAEDFAEQLRAGVPEEVERRLGMVLAKAKDSHDANDANESVDHATPEDVNDVTSRRELEKVFEGLNFQAIALAAWHSERSEILGGDEQPTLLLVDRNFSREGGSADTGDAIVADIVRSVMSPHIRCCLLTHSASNREEALALQKEIESTNELPQNSVAVLGKGELSSNPQQFALRLFGVLLQEEFARVKETLSDAIDAAQGAAHTRLSNVTDYEMLCMFTSALNEGVHEPTHLLRPLKAAARRAATSTLFRRDDDAEGLRKLHSAIETEGVREAVGREDLSPLLSGEYIDTGTFLSETFQPIDTGDIFALVNFNSGDIEQVQETENYLILLAQPCDVMVRGNGRRGPNAPEYWTLARVHKPKSDDRRSGTTVVLPTFVDGHSRVVHLAQVVHAPVLALDMCVFGADGLSQMSASDVVASTVPRAWANRHGHLVGEVSKFVEGAVSAKIETLESPAKSAVLAGMAGLFAPEFGSLGRKQRISVSVSPATETLAFGLKRVGRLNDSTTRSLLVQATHHQGRPADEVTLAKDH